MVSEFFQSLASYQRAIDLISRHKLWRFVYIPGLIGLGIGLGILALALVYAGDIGLALSSFYPKDWFGAEVIDDIFAVLAFVFVLGASVFAFKYLVMIVVAPFMGPLSEKIEALETGRPAPPFSLKNTVVDLMRAIRISLRNIFRELLLTFPLLLLNFVPVIGNLLAAVLIFLVQAYFAGFGNMDPCLERKRFSIRQRVGFVRQHRGLATGNGTVFVLLLMVPVLGWFLAPAYGVSAATLLTLEKLEKAGISKH